MTGAREEGWIRVAEDLRLHRTSKGTGDRAVVIPAGFFLADSFDPLLPGRTLHFYDMRDRGRSDPVKDRSRVGVEDDVRDLEAVRRHLGLERMSLVGWSYLGVVVALYAFRHPGRVARVVQIGPAPPRSDPPYAEATAGAYTDAADPDGLARLESLREAGIPERDPSRYYREHWRVFKPALFGDPSRAEAWELPPDDLPNEWVDRLNRHFRAKSESFTDYDLRRQAAELDVPVLTVHGTGDRNTPFEGGREWVASFRRGRLLSVEGAGHVPFAERPELVLPAVDVFLDGNWPEGAEAVGGDRRPAGEGEEGGPELGGAERVAAPGGAEEPE